MPRDDAIRIRHMIEAAPKRASASYPDAVEPSLKPT
jgi:hypothetical protein